MILMKRLQFAVDALSVFTQVLCLCLFGVIVVVKPRSTPLRFSETGAVLWHQNGIFTPRPVNDSCFAVCCSSLNTPWHTSPLETAVCLSVCLWYWTVVANDASFTARIVWGEKFGSDFLHTASLLQLILLIGSSMEITRGMIGSPGSRRLRGFSQPLILPP